MTQGLRARARNSRKRARHAAKALHASANSNAVRDAPASQGRLEAKAVDGSSGQTRAPRALRQRASAPRHATARTSRTRVPRAGTLRANATSIAAKGAPAGQGRLEPKAVDGSSDQTRARRATGRTSRMRVLRAGTPRASETSIAARDAPADRGRLAAKAARVRIRGRLARKRQGRETARLLKAQGRRAAKALHASASSKAEKDARAGQGLPAAKAARGLMGRANRAAPASLVGQAGQAAESLAANRLRAARAVLVKSCAL